MFYISRETPAYYFTAVTHHRLPIFRKGEMKDVLCGAYQEACNRHGILMLAYVVMPDHTHLLTRSEQAMPDVLRLLNGVAARRIIQYLQENGFQNSLFKLRGEDKGRNHRHSVWQHHSDSFEIFGEETFRQKVEYIHQNPVRAGFAEDPFEDRFSSARLWAERGQSDEPLITQHRQIKWSAA